MPADLDAMVVAYWRYHQLFQGTRQERLARDAYFWAWDALETAVMESPFEAIEMIDAVLRHPDAEPLYVGAGPIENVSGAYVDDPIPASVAPYVMQPRAASAPNREVPAPTTRRKSRRPRPAGKPRRLPGR